MPKSDGVLEKEGWERKFVTEEPRLSEMVEIYRSLGLEVHLEPVSTEKRNDDDECQECRICFEGQPEGEYMIIYTRPSKTESIQESG